MSEVYYEVHMTRVLHTARISNVDSVMFANRIREMVSFELGKEIEKDDTFLSTLIVLYSHSDKNDTLYHLILTVHM